MVFLPMFAAALAFVQGPAADIPSKFRMTVPSKDTVVAKVNDVSIKAGDVEDLLWEWRGFDAIQDVIGYEVVKQEAQRRRIDVSDKEVEDAMNAAIKEMSTKLRPGETVDLMLLGNGFTKSRLFLRYKTEAYLNAIVERDFQADKLVKISTMIFKPENSSAVAATNAINRANDAYARLKKGEAWDAVINSTQSNPQVRESKGLLGWRLLSAFPAEAATELKGLKAGGFTEPFQTENGFQIFRLELAGKDAKGEDAQQMRAIYINSEKQPLLEKLRKESKIEKLYPPIPGLNSQKDGN